MLADEQSICTQNAIPTVDLRAGGFEIGGNEAADHFAGVDDREKSLRSQTLHNGNGRISMSDNCCVSHKYSIALSSFDEISELSKSDVGNLVCIDYTLSTLDDLEKLMSYLRANPGKRITGNLNVV